jgi:hypothetical protein
VGPEAEKAQRTRSCAEALKKAYNPSSDTTNMFGVDMYGLHLDRCNVHDRNGLSPFLRFL